jgi:hypothetical protein
LSTFLIVAPVWGVKVNKRLVLEDDLSIYPCPYPDLDNFTKIEEARLDQLVRDAIAYEIEFGGIDLETPDFELKAKARAGALLGIGLFDSWQEMIRSISDDTGKIHNLYRFYFHWLLMDRMAGPITTPEALPDTDKLASEINLEHEEKEHSRLYEDLTLSCFREENPGVFAQIWKIYSQAIKRKNKAIQAAREDSDAACIYIAALPEMANDTLKRWDFGDDNLLIWHAGISHIRRIVSEHMKLQTFRLFAQDDFDNPFEWMEGESSFAGCLSANSFLAFRFEAADSETATASAKKAVEEFLLRCRVFMPCDVEIPYFFRFNDKGEGDEIWFDAREKDKKHTKDNVAVLRPSFKSYWSRFNDLRTKAEYYRKKDYRIVLALNAFDDSFHWGVPEWQIVRLVCCLESITSQQSESKTDLKLKVSDRTAWLLSDSDGDYRRIRKDVRDAYDLRSSVVHGQTKETKPPKRTPLELVSPLENITRMALKRMCGIFLSEAHGPEGFIADFKDLHQLLADVRTAKPLRSRAKRSFKF